MIGSFNYRSCSVRILYIEDVDVYVDTVGRITSHLGHELLVAANGREGLELLNRQPALILTDLGLPDINGLDLIPQIRAHCPDTPLIAFTGRALEGEREQCLAAG